MDCNCLALKRHMSAAKNVFYDCRAEVYLVNDRDSIATAVLGDSCNYTCSHQAKTSFRDLEYPVYRLNIRKHAWNTFATVELYPLVPWMEGVTKADFITDLKSKYLICEHRNIILDNDQYNSMYELRQNGEEVIKYLTENLKLQITDDASVAYYTDNSYKNNYLSWIKWKDR